MRAVLRNPLVVCGLCFRSTHRKVRVGKAKPHPPQNLAQTHPAELPFLG
ncbi:MAG: hypothetical protein LBT53_07295 [Puniceicoccales bacterium]|nr:hypothetical protein [Puniceicoccales bacterium]